ncbi:MAG: hypothetical protein AAF658_01380, partial [Myxococcota bacterium]
MKMNTRRESVIGLVLLLVGACSDSDEFPCIAGTLECACTEGQCLDEGAVCINGTCSVVSCEVGSEGCACDEDYTCGVDPSGRPLACAGGLCAPPFCPPGDLGCECIGAGACNDALVCSDVSGVFRCEAADCPPGELGCSCFLDRTCDFDTTGRRLVCDGAQCVPQTCDPGSAGCVCTSNFGCESGLLCSADQRCDPITCAPGTIGCQCSQGGLCASSTLQCDAGVCQEIGCPPGTAGCGCTAGETCESGALVCENGRCGSPSCRTGNLGCACFNDGSCDLGGLCESGWCMASDCIAGRENCPCDEGSCGDGLVCLADTICVDDVGYPGGECLANQTCRSGARCEAGTCFACVPGQMGCDCADGAVCATGLACLAGRCIAEGSLVGQIPDDPVCYTPCSDDLRRPDGTILTCDAEGLLEGCLEGTSCVGGTCLENASVPFFNGPSSEELAQVPSCTSNVDCPDYQACIQGKCFSQCEDSGDCDQPLVCHRKVCRVPCDVENEPCPSGAVCEADEGTSGFCFDVDDPTVTGALADGGFRILDTRVDFSAVTDSGSVFVYNSGPRQSTLRVRKGYHSEFHEDPSDDRRVSSTVNGQSCETVGECPLEWLTMGWQSSSVTVALSPVQLLEVSVGGGCEAEPIQCQSDADCGSGLSGNVCNSDGFCECDPNADNAPPACEDATACLARLDFAGAASFGDDTITSWQGEVTVELPGREQDTVFFQYRAGSEGRWVGTAHYYANFEDTGVNEWVAGGRSDADLALVQNALVTQWGAFRRGDLPWELFEALLRATETESWRFPNVQARCDDAACYLHDRGEGIGVYSSSLRTQPIPTGAVELPFGMNVTPDREASGFEAVGKIDSSGTLHYPGEPVVNLTFETDPGQCLPGFGEDCVAFLQDFGAQIVVGGRYLADDGDLGCDERPDGTYKRLEFPWLVDGFAPPGFAGSLDAIPDAKYECRDALIPRDPTSGNTQEIEDANMRATAANPIPDAQTRTRFLELIDGVVVNETDLFILFKETFESAGRVNEGYGYLRLQRIPATLDKEDSDGDGLANDFDGNAPPAVRSEPTNVLGATCNSDLLSEALGFVNAELSGSCAANDLGACVDELSQMLLVGRSVAPVTPLNPTQEVVHYLCVDTGLFDGGPSSFTNTNEPPNDDTCTCRGGACNRCQDDFATNFDPFAIDRTVDRNPVNEQCEYIAGDGLCDDGGPGASSSMCAFGTDASDCGLRTPSDLVLECPADSEVIFFTVDPGDITQNMIDALDCQQTEGTSVAFGGEAQGTCATQLQQWRSGGRIVQEDPFFVCADSSRTFCDANRGDLREGKRFFQAASTDPGYERLTTQIDQAFRYKTQFLGRAGTGVGFVPEICSSTPELRPYCYDPVLIERSKQRVECLTHLYTTYY